MDSLNKHRLNQIVQQLGYDNVHAFKNDFGIGSGQDIASDPPGNLYTVPVAGKGAPQPIGVRVP
jgi:hypothetical protein